MKIFLDTYNLQEIRKFSALGIVDGITTNPSLLSNVTTPIFELAETLCQSIKGDVSIEIVSEDYEDIIQQGQKLSKIASNIVLKLPITYSGLKACHYFSSNNIKTNMTLCFSTTQALLASKAGATYVSPFIGRLEDNNEDGLKLISDIRTVYSNYNFKTQILAASIRSVEHVKQSAIIGADAVTINPTIASELYAHKLTDSGLLQFEKDWANSGLKI
jgi:transaldolase